MPSWRKRLSTRERFDDGSSLEPVNRYTIRYREAGRYVDVGFEDAVSDEVDRLVHAGSIEHWHGDKGMLPVTEAEKREVLQKISRYCELRGVRSKVQE